MTTSIPLPNDYYKIKQHFFVYNVTMKNKLECVVCDLDGSLLNDDKKVSKEDLETIRTLKNKGIKFFICTGRPFPLSKQIAYEVGFDCPTINCNGAYGYDYLNNKVLFHTKEIDTSDVLDIYHFVKKNNYSYLIYSLEKLLFDRPDSKRTLYWKKQLEEVFSKENAFEIEYYDENKIDLKDLHVMKILLPYIDQNGLDLFNKTLNKDHKFEAVFSEKDVLDITYKGINKGYGIKKMSEIYNFNLENTLALGDNYNDLDMLNIVGYPVVTGNAKEDIKKVAKYITTSNNDSPLTNIINKLFKDIL